MKYTAEQLQRLRDMRDTFKACRKHLGKTLGDGKRYYICHALEKTRSNGVIDARSLISRAIDPYESYSDWLEGMAPQAFGDGTYGEIQALRHKWVNKLIADITAEIEANERG